MGGSYARYPDNYTIRSHIANGRPKSAPGLVSLCVFFNVLMSLVFVCFVLFVPLLSGYMCPSHVFSHVGDF